MKIMKIAIIDEGIDIDKLLHPEYLKKVISLIDKRQFSYFEPEGTHGTKCAQLLETCAQDYELFDIRIASNWHTPVNIYRIRNALECCIVEKVNIICLSAGSVCLSEEKVLGETIKKLDKLGIILVASLSNCGYITLPGSYQSVVCAVMDWNGLLYPGKCALAEHKILGKLLIANIQILPNTLGTCQGNSYAVPVAAGWIVSQIRKNKFYQVAELYESLPLTSSGFEKNDWAIPAESPVVNVIVKEPTLETIVLLDTMAEDFRLEAIAVVEEYNGDDFRIFVWQRAFFTPL